MGEKSSPNFDPVRELQETSKDTARPEMSNFRQISYPHGSVFFNDRCHKPPRQNEIKCRPFSEQMLSKLKRARDLLTCHLPR